MIMYRVEADFGSDGYGVNYKTAEDVYNDLVDLVDHDEAANVQGWCELASVGDVYEGNMFFVYILEDD